MLDLDQWLEYIQSVHRRSIDLGLDRVRRVAHAMRLASLPRVITIAGTNGKGSSVAMLESIYMAAGYRTGVYTSPHLVSYNERIRTQRAPVTRDAICKAFERIEQARADTPLTYFEFGTLAALQIFSRSNLDVLMLEVGMGGRLDAANIVDSDVAYIVSIGRDHTQWLGERRDQIAREKAGIMRYQRPVVCADINPPNSIFESAVNAGARLWQINQDFAYQQQDNLWSWSESAYGVDTKLTDLPFVNIPGDKQLLNAAGVLCVISRMQKALPVTHKQIADGLNTVRIPGRLQVIDQQPRLIFDVAHNAESAQCLSQFLSSDECKGRTLAVFAALADKPLEEIAQILLDRVDQWFVAGLEGERGAQGGDLLARILNIHTGTTASSHDDPVSAYRAALREANSADRIVIFGSFVTVGAIMEYLDFPVYC